MTGCIRALLEKLSDLWSTTRFRDRAHAQYAERLMVDETRAGVRTLCLILLLPLALCVLFGARLGLNQHYAYTGAALSALCAHIFFSVRPVRELRTLHVLAMALLVITGSAFVLLAHKTGAIGVALFASVVLLFMTIPMVPWGLREASLVTLLVYGMFSASTWSIAGRFEETTLWTLQAFMLSAAAVSLTLVGRGAQVRKGDIVARYALEQAHERAQRQSLQDPLTGAWNRRYLELEFHGFVERARKRGEVFCFAIADLDHFKRLNDTWGHTVGDEALCRVTRLLESAIGDAGFLVRTGGDEFALVIRGENPEELLHSPLEAMGRTDAAHSDRGSLPQVFLSIGVLTIPPDRAVSLDDAYRLADLALYEAKRSKDPNAPRHGVVRSCAPSPRDPCAPRSES